MKTKAFLIIFAFLLLSCKAMIKNAYGVKNPQFETIQTTGAYLEGYSVDSEKLWITRDLDAYASLLNTKEPPYLFRMLIFLMRKESF